MAPSTRKVTRVGYLNYTENGVTFVFKTDSADSTLLHIYARHLMEPADAMLVWFEGAHEWNASHRRYEAIFEGIRIFWYWIDEPKQVVMIASCHNV